MEKMTELEEKLFLEMKQLINEKNEEEFLYFVQVNDFLLKVNPVLFIINHVSFYAELENLPKALEVISYYKNGPYISMEVEELLNELKEKVASIINKPKKDYDDEKIRKMLFSNNEEARLSALKYLSSQNIRLYLTLVKEYLLSSFKYKFKTLALFILIEQKVDENIKVEKNGRIFTYNPSLLKFPFDEEYYLACKNEIEKNSKVDPSVSQIAIELLNTIQIKEYPDSVLEMDTYKLIADILLDISNNYINGSNERVNVSNRYNLEPSKIQEIIDEINRLLVE